MKFLRENENQLRFNQCMLSKLQRGECNDFWKEIKAFNLKKESLALTVGGTSGESNIATEVYKFAAERMLTIMSLFFSGCMITGKLPSTLMHVVIIPLLKYKS